MTSHSTTQTPLLSVVVVVFNMRREAPRTLTTLTSSYQRIPSDLYEVIVVENGSDQALGAQAVAAVDPSFRYLPFPATTPSPAAAINAAVRQARAPAVGILIDGARMLSPGVLRYALRTLRAYRRPLISTLGCHLGHQPQQQSIAEGYCQDVEDELLASVDWREDGYRLFDIASLAGSSQYGILSPLAESNALFMPRQMFDELGGFDERFVSPGGGLVNLDFYQRAQRLPNVQLVTLLGEATFHQVHGGVTTRPGDTWSRLGEEYKAIRGEDFQHFRIPWLRTDYIGQVPEPFIPWLERAVQQRVPLRVTVPQDPYAGAPDPEPLLPTEGQQQRVIAVLGMHRSGTSLLAGTLQEAGLVLGDVVNSAPHNRKGNRESLLIRQLHDDLLQRAGGSWDHPPSSVSWEPVHAALRDAVIAGFSDHPIWGFKDPRTLFCLEGWLDVLPHLELVAILRHPEEVALSLQARSGLSLPQGLDLWLLYNTRLLSWLDYRQFPLLHYGADPQHFRGQAAQLIEDLRLPRPLTAADLQFHDPLLRHQERQGLPLPDAVEKLYAALQERLTPLSLVVPDADCIQPSGQPSRRSWRGRAREIWQRLRRSEHRNLR